ncbi:Leucine rich repeat-containing protein [Prevotellaceae bacterium HUN156]|nr:Leucine rich repeat-containing protein [Prevotellaceae bacterium HUN156]
MKKTIYILIALLLPLAARADYTLSTINVTVGGNTQAAVTRLDATNKIALLGNGYNACIPYWSEGALTIPGTVSVGDDTYTVEVGPVAFRLCSNLTSITIGEGVTKIDDYAFVGCSSVAKITLPKTLTTIERGAFVNMKSLKIMVCNATSAPAWSWNDIFSDKGTKESMTNMAAERIMYVPEGHESSYLSTKFDGTSYGKETVGWQEAFTRIYEMNDEPQEITSLQDLKDFRDAVNSGNKYKGSNNKMVTLTADLDLSSIDNWTPIGTSVHPFDGVFNGGGHVIKNLNVSGSSNNNGLFGYATKATIYNMHLLNPTVSGPDYVGTVVGYVDGDSHITDILVTSNCDGNDGYTAKATDGSVGGIVGRANNATIERCLFNGWVKGTGWTGGIIGNVNTNVTITDCSASDFVQNTKDLLAEKIPFTGGIVGGAGYVTIERCFVRNTVSYTGSPSTFPGIIVGGTNNVTTSTIKNCAYLDIGRLLIGQPQAGSNNTETDNQGYTDRSDMNQDKTKSVLGEDNWYYFTDNYIDYPIPATLKDMYIANCVDKVDGDFVYRPAKAADSEYEVVAYTGSATSVTVPDTYDGKNVTAILPEVFKDNTMMTSVTIGNNVTTIGASAFENCDALTTVNFGSGVTTINAKAFYDCDALTSVDLPDAVTDVGSDAFVSCDALTTFNIGRGFTDHTGNFLAYCPQLTTLTTSRGNDNGYLCVDNVLIHNVGDYRSYVIACAPGKTGDYVIPVSSLTNYTVNVFGSCFASCTGLTSVTFPAGKRFSLGKGVFDGAYNLRYVNLSAITGTIEDVKYTVNRSDADSPFYGMSEYTMIYLPSGHSAANDEVNAVIGGTATAGIKLNDGWDFNPPLSITAGGATLNRALTAKSVTYAKLVTDSNGDPIVIGTVPVYDANGDPVYEGDGITPKTRNIYQTESEVRLDPCGYTCYLPYALTLSEENAKVYKPYTSSVEGGVTTITFEQVENNAMEAYKPYYIVVSGSSGVDLSTDKNITIVSDTNGSWTVGGYELKGTTTTIPNSTLYDANKPTYILQSDGKWHKVPQNQPKAYIGPFRAYFQATTNSGARALNMVIDDGEATTIDAVIRTIDADGTEHYYDMNGRLLSGKPQKGMYIHNGKKYINK